MTSRERIRSWYGQAACWVLGQHRPDHAADACRRCGLRGQEIHVLDHEISDALIAEINAMMTWCRRRFAMDMYGDPFHYEIPGDLGLPWAPTYP